MQDNSNVKENTAEEQIKQANQFSLALLFSISFIILVASFSYLLLSNAIINMASFIKERHIFMCCILTLLPLCFTGIQVSTYIIDKWHRNYLFGMSITLYVISFWLLFWLTTIPALSSFWELITYGLPALYAPFKHPNFMLGLFIFVAFLGCAVTMPHLIRKINTEPSRAQYFFWLIALTTGSILAGSQIVSGLSAIIPDVSRWGSNFEPLLYPVSQVLAGKTLLADLPAQYGLYAELINLFFKNTPFSISKISFLFALMEALSYLALAFVFLKLTKSWSFRLFWVISSAVVFGLAFQNYSDYLCYDPYNQYFPLRLFFPAISVFLFWQYISVKPRARNAVGISVLLTCAIIWNLDSGIPTLGSFFTYLMLSIFFAKKTKETGLIKIFILATLAAAATLGGFAVYMTLKAGVTIPWNEWLHYQRIFYLLGLNALPLPLTPHPWMAVIVIYTIGILGYMRSASKGLSEPFWNLMLYLSVLGLGLFSYYQHRSHDAVFVAVFWPALFIGYACSERFLRYIMTEHLPKLWVIALLPSFIFGSAFCGFFLYKFPAMIGLSKHNWTMAFSNKETPVIENIAFMRERIPKDARNSVEIIALFQAVYFAELGIPSAIKGPGIGGAMPGEDQVTLLKQLHATKPRIVFLEKGLMPLIEKAMRQEYRFVGENKNHLMDFRAQ